MSIERFYAVSCDHCGRFVGDPKRLDRYLMTAPTIVEQTIIRLRDTARALGAKFIDGKDVCSSCHRADRAAAERKQNALALTSRGPCSETLDTP